MSNNKKAPAKVESPVEKTEEAKAPAKVESPVEKTEEFLSGTYIMKVGRLCWGRNNKNYFYADKKPLINAKVLGGYAGILEVWLNAGWIEKGSYK